MPAAHHNTHNHTIEPQYDNQRAPPPFPCCPDFFQTTVNGSVPVYGPMTNSVHYQLSVQRINYGRNTYIQSRFYSNLQDTPLRDVKVCIVVESWSRNISRTTQSVAADEPQFKNRLQFKPRIKGAQPTAVLTPQTGFQYYNTSQFQNRNTYCTVIPYVKPKGWQKVSWLLLYISFSPAAQHEPTHTTPLYKHKSPHQVDWLYFTEPCLYTATWKSWISFPNPYNATQTCDSRISSSLNPPQCSTAKYTVRSLVVRDSHFELMLLCACVLHLFDGLGQPCPAVD